MSELEDYDYDLPRDLIAQHPLPVRTDARLLVVNRAQGTLEHRYIRDLPEYVTPQDCLVFNDTRVLPARLVGRRERTGARWTGLFLSADDAGNWQILSKTRGKLEPGEAISVLSWDLRQSIRLRLLARLEGGIWAVRPEPMGDAFEVLQTVGRVPLPPYIREGEMIEGDLQSYQTIFAQQPGAVAAPTAGLHFTPELLQRLQHEGVGQAAVTLHVGIGTFRPITSDRLDEHIMHTEWCSITSDVVERLRQTREAGGRIVAVGTTVARTLEAASSGGRLEPFSGSTDLFIRPPYKFRAVDALLTNFHLPKSTLLILVRTFGGDALLRRAYTAAIDEQYRFYSYGDAMLIV